MDKEGIEAESEKDSNGLDRFEELYGEWGEVQYGDRRSPSRRPGGWNGNPRPESKIKSTPESRIAKVLAAFDCKVNDPPGKIEKLKAKKQSLLNWVKVAITDENQVMREEDLSVTEDNSGELPVVNVHHKPSGFFVRNAGEKTAEVNLIFAKDELSLLLNRHIKDWKRVSENLRIQNGLDLSIPQEKPVTG